MVCVGVGRCALQLQFIADQLKVKRGFKWGGQNIGLDFCVGAAVTVRVTIADLIVTWCSAFMEQFVSIQQIPRQGTSVWRRVQRDVAVVQAIAVIGAEVHGGQWLDDELHRDDAVATGVGLQQRDVVTLSSDGGSVGHGEHFPVANFRRIRQVIGLVQLQVNRHAAIAS